MAEFGEQLRKKREEKGMTQQSLAEKVFVTRQTVSRWEGGERFPDLMTVKNIAKVLDVDIGYLLSDEKATHIVERNPVIEKSSVNKVTLVLFSFIIISYVILIVGFLIRMPVLLETLSVREFGISTGSNILSELLIVVAFTLGFVWILKDAFSPKKVGLVIMMFFTGTFIKEGSIFLLSLSSSNWVTSLVPMLISILGFVSSYFFFCKKTHLVSFSYVLFIVSTLGILKACFTVITMVTFAGMYISLETALKAVLSICIYVLIIIQTSALLRKRNMEYIVR